MHQFKQFIGRNIAVACSCYQFVPAALCLLQHWRKPATDAWSYIGIFLIAEFVLVLLIWNMVQKSNSDVIDERENSIRLQVKSLISDVVEVSLVITTLTYFFVTKELSSIVALMMIGIPALLAEAYGNWAFRKI